GVDPLADEPAAQVGAEKGRRLGLADDVFTVQWLKLRHDLARRRMFRQRCKSRCLEAEDAGIRAILRVDHAGEDDRQPLRSRALQQPLGACNRCANIAAAEQRGIVKAVNEVDNQQRRAAAKAAAVAEALLPIDVKLAHELAQCARPDHDFQYWEKRVATMSS